MGFMSNVQLGRPLLVLLAMLVGLVLIVPVVRAGIAIGPEAMTVTVALDKAAYLSGDTAKANAIVYRTPVPANYTYTWTVRDTFFRVLNTTAGGATYSYPIPLNYTGRITVDAREGANSTSASVSINQASGVFLGVSFDKSSYVPGEIIHAHLSVTPKGATALPIQFSWTLSLGLAFAGAPTASAITTMPETDLYLQVPQGLGTGDLLIVATESSTGTFQYQTVHIGTASSGLSAEIGGVPIYAVVPGLLFPLLLVAVLGLWRRTGGGSLFGPRAARPPPGPGPVQAPASAPMSIACRRCGKPVEITTSKRPIEVMCPSCGETQVVT